MFAARWLVAVTALGLVWGCAKKDTHPKPLAFDCDAGGCQPPPNGGGASGGTDGGVGGSTATGGAAGATSDAGNSVDVTGSVVELVEGQFTSGTPYAQTAKVRMQGPTGLDVEGSYDGVGFKLSAVDRGPSVWATVIPTGVIVLSTFQPVDTEASQTLTLAVVPAATIDQIYSFMTVPTTRTKGAAHVVLHFVDASDKPVKNVKVTHQGETVAYDANGSWSDVAAGTGVDGWAVVANVTASATPAKQMFQYAAGTTTGGVEVLLASDSVTLAQVLVAP